MSKHMINSSTSRYLAFAAAACVLLAGSGCSNPTSRLNAPPQGTTCTPHERQDEYVYMNDNAMLADMTMSPCHFVGRTAELNATGVRRLKRYVSILKIYGGELNYDGVDEPEKMAGERTEKIKTYLVASGVEPDQFSVKVGMAGGRGMNGGEAGEVRKASKFSADKPQQGSPGATAVFGGAG